MAALELSAREKDLITSALYIMESQCAGDELHHEIADDLGGTPDHEEIRTLMDKIEED